MPILAAGSEKKGGVAAQDYTLCRGCKSSEFTLKVTGKPNWHGVRDQRIARGEVTNCMSHLHVTFVLERPVSSAADAVSTRRKRLEKISLCGNEGYRCALKTAR